MPVKLRASTNSRWNTDNAIQLVSYTLRLSLEGLQNAFKSCNTSPEPFTKLAPKRSIQPVLVLSYPALQFLDGDESHASAPYKREMRLDVALE
jgi:hypothetical protein